MRSLALLASSAFAVAMLPAVASAEARNVFAAHVAARPAQTQSVKFLVHLPIRDEAGLESLVRMQTMPGSFAYHRWLSPAQFATAYGSTPARLGAVVRSLRSSGVSVDRVSSQLISAHAPVATLERAFGVRMVTFRERDGRTHVGSLTEVRLPDALKAANATVDGMVYHGSGFPMLHVGPRVDGTALRPTTPGTKTGAPSGGGGPVGGPRTGTGAPRVGGAKTPTPQNRYGLFGPLWFDDIKQAYDLPSYASGRGVGVTVATVNEADFSSADLVQFLQHELIGNVKGDLAPLPKIEHFLVPGAPAFDPNNGASNEANLDTQQVAGIAPGATLVGYTTDAFNFPSDFVQVYDYINQTNGADIVSTSYGECENVFTAAYNGGQDFTGTLRSLHDEFLQGNSEGITFTVSSGDSAALPCPELAYFTNPGSGKNYKNVPSVDIPASDPNVVAVGGGNLITSYDPANPKDLNSTYVTENAYADPETPSDPYGFGNMVTNNYWGAGTGQSTVWPKPSWQKNRTPGTTRSVPDAGLFVGGCFDGDPAFVQPCQNDVTHAIFTLAGSNYLVIGTSVAAPEFAGVLADLEQINGSGKTPGAGRLGNANPMLYGSPAKYFHKSIPGFDGVVSFGGSSATGAWEPSYGLGSIFNAIPYPGTAAGTPQTPSNP